MRKAVRGAFLYGLTLAVIVFGAIFTLPGEAFTNDLPELFADWGRENVIRLAVGSIPLFAFCTWFLIADYSKGIKPVFLQSVAAMFGTLLPLAATLFTLFIWRTAFG